jgi:hypothetical protein
MSIRPRVRKIYFLAFRGSRLGPEASGLGFEALIRGFEVPGIGLEVLVFSFELLGGFFEVAWGTRHFYDR